MKKKLSRWTAVFTVMLLCMGLCSGLPVSAAYENTHVNSGNPRVDIVEIAKTQIGYLEGSLEGTVKGNNNYTKYNVWNGRISGYGSDGYGYPWCHTFVSWCANQAGIGTDVIPRTAGTGTGRSFFVRQGTYQQSAANGGSYVPQAGDIIYYGSAVSCGNRLRLQRQHGLRHRGQLLGYGHYESHRTVGWLYHRVRRAEL